MKTSYLFLANGFEEIEAIATIDILRRAAVELKTVSIHPTREVVGAHHVTLQADILLSELPQGEMEYLILPGGMPGTTHLDECEVLRHTLAEHAQQGGKLAAICAAPLVLGKMGLLEGKEATCYLGFEEYLTGAILNPAAVVAAPNTLTGNGPGAAIPFALAIVADLKGSEVAENVAHGMQYPPRK